MRINNKSLMSGGSAYYRYKAQRIMDTRELALFVQRAIEKAQKGTALTAHEELAVKEWL
jgi:hypothetical protein